MPYYRKISGERVYLSPINSDEAEKYTRWINDLDTTINLSMASKIISLDMEKEFLDNIQKEGYSFAIVQQEKDELIGTCGLVGVDMVQRTAELGIFIGESQKRGRGYGAEAISLLLDYAFNLLNLNSIMLGTFSFNERAIACYKKVGFREIGRRRQARIMGAKKFDAILMDILAEEYHSVRLQNLVP